MRKPKDVSADPKARKQALSDEQLDKASGGDAWEPTAPLGPSTAPPPPDNSLGHLWFKEQLKNGR